MAYGLMLRLMLAGFTFTVAVSQSENDDSEVLACRLTSKLQRAESTSDAQITAILEYKFTQIEYEGAIQCRLEGRDGTVQYVPFSVVVLHDPPTELRVSIPMALRAKLEASTMICRYADIGLDRHVRNEIPDTAKPTEENGVYKCGEGTDFQIVLTELLENSAKPRQERMDKNLMCSRFGTKSDQDAPANAVKAEYCDMFNGTAGVKMFTEKNGYQCSRCCPNHVFNIKKMMCEPCPAHSHKKGYSFFGHCFPGDPSDQTPPHSNPRNEPSIQFNKEQIDRNTTFVSIAWVLSGERSLFSHFQVVMEREAFSPREFETDETFLNITGLTPDTFYCFTVTALPVAVEEGKDLPNSVLWVQTLFVIPAVEDLNVAVTGGKALVTWTSQPDYTLKLVLNFTREESEVPCDEKTLDRVVQDFKGRVSFELRCEGVFNLRAHYHDLHGRHGPESDSLKFIFKQKPKSAPTILAVEANTTSALIKWDKVQSTKENPIKYYLLHYNNEGTVVHTKDDKTSWKLEELTPNTNYEVCVAAVNTEGEGPCSSPHSFQTLFVIPKMTGISVNQSNDQIYVSWKPQKKFNVSVQITCSFNGSTPEVWHINDELGKFDFNLRSYGKYDIVIQYSDENTDREGPPAHKETLEYSESSQVGTTIAVVFLVAFMIAVVIIYRNRSKVMQKINQCWTNL